MVLEPFCGAAAIWALLQKSSACLEQLGVGSGLCRQPAGAIYQGQNVLSKVLGLWERAADLGLLTPSCCLHHIHSWNMAAEPFGKVRTCGGLKNWVSAPQVFAGSH